MILDIQGTPGPVAKRVNIETPFNANNSVRLKYFHLPDLPLLDYFTDAVTVAGADLSIPATSSIQQMVNELDAMTHNGARVFYCWYNQHEFELCTGTNAVALSPAFSSAVKMPATLTANTCYSSSLFEGQLSQYSHYAVRVGGTRGFWDGGTYNEFIAKVRRDGDISNAHSHFFTRSTDVMDVEVFAVKRDGTTVAYYSPEVWSIGIAFK